MPEAPTNKEDLEVQLNKLISDDYNISISWISDDELALNPSMVKTMSVKPLLVEVKWTELGR